MNDLSAVAESATDKERESNAVSALDLLSIEKVVSITAENKAISLERLVEELSGQLRTPNKLRMEESSDICSFDESRRNPIREVQILWYSLTAISMQGSDRFIMVTLGVGIRKYSILLAGRHAG
jgi:hypothetical protein